jgi:hypothetical protein
MKVILNFLYYRQPAFESRNAYKNRKWPEHSNKWSSENFAHKNKKMMKDIKKDVKSLEKTFSKLSNSENSENILIPTGEMMQVIAGESALELGSK